MEKIGYFEVSPGNKSIMRAMFAFLMLNATGMGWVALLMEGGGVGAAAAVFGTVAGVATGLKVMQKNQEVSKPIEKPKIDG